MNLLRRVLVLAQLLVVPALVYGQCIDMNSCPVSFTGGGIVNVNGVTISGATAPCVGVLNVSCGDYVINNNDGTITASSMGSNGIRATSAAINNNGGRITATCGVALRILQTGSLCNSGSIQSATGCGLSANINGPCNATFNFNNSGSISGGSTAALVCLNTPRAFLNFNNSGTIAGNSGLIVSVSNPAFFGPDGSITNSGLIAGNGGNGLIASFAGNSTTGMILNSGTITGTIGSRLQAGGQIGTLTFLNTGTLSASTSSGPALTIRDTTSGSISAVNVQNRGFITGPGQAVAICQPFGGNTHLVNSGTIDSTGCGIFLNAGTSTCTTISNSGTISSGGFGAFLRSAANCGTIGFSNSGTVSTPNLIGLRVCALGMNNTFNLENSGLLSGTLAVGIRNIESGGTISLQNSGSISSTSITGLCLQTTGTGSTHVVTNSGFILGPAGGAAATLRGDAQQFVLCNTGTIQGAFVRAGVSLDTSLTNSTMRIDNAGCIQAGSILTNASGVLITSGGSSSTITFTNSGSLGSNLGPGITVCASGTNSLILGNSGLINGTLAANITDLTVGGSMTFSNSGTISGITAGYLFRTSGTLASNRLDNSGSIVGFRRGAQLSIGGCCQQFTLSNTGTIQSGILAEALTVETSGTNANVSVTNGGTIAVGTLSTFNAVLLTSTGSNSTISFINNGTIMSAVGSAWAICDTGTNMLNLVNNGQVHSTGARGVDLMSAGLAFTNTGSISGFSCGIRAGTNGSIVNSGTVTAASNGGAAIFLTCGGTLTNTGLVTATGGATPILTGGTGAAVVDCSGTVIANGTPAIALLGCGTQALTLRTGSQVLGDIQGNTVSSSIALDGTGTYGGTVDGFNTLAKTGGGTWILNGAATISCASNVNVGTLGIEGTLTSLVQVATTGTLTGNGLIIGNVNNGGQVHTLLATASLNVNGTYTQMSSGNYNALVLSATDFNRLTINGSAALSGTLTVGFPRPFAFQNLQLRIIDPTGPITGDFDNFIAPQSAALRFGYFIDPDPAVVLTIQRTPYQQLARNVPETAVAGGIDQAIPLSMFQDPNDPTSFAFLLGRLDMLPTQDAVNQALDQLSPITYEMHRELMLLNAQMFATQMDHYFDELRLNLDSPFARRGTSSGQTALAADAFTGNAAPQLPSPAGLSRFYAPDSKMGAFAYAYGFHANEPTEYALGGVNSNGFALRSTGGMAGVDRKVNDRTTIGLTIGGGDARGTLDLGRGSTRASTFQVGPYLTYNHKHFFVDAAASYNNFNFDSQRIVQFPGLFEVEGAHHTGHTVSGYANTGYLWRSQDNWIFGPTVSAQYTHLELDAFGEVGGSARLTMQDWRSNSFRTTVGGRIAKEIRLKRGGTIIPEVRARWAHEWNDPGSIAASFASAGGGLFTTPIATRTRDSALVGGSVTALISRNWSAFGTFDADLGRAGGDATAWKGGFSFKF